MSIALDERIAALSPAQRALLERRLAERGVALGGQGAARAAPDRPADATLDASPEASSDTLPLTPAQQQLWVVQQFQPDSSAYHIAFTWTLDGPLDADALAAALQALGDRHDALRSVFESVGGQPHQRVLPQVDFGLQRMDWRSRSDAAEPELLAETMAAHLRAFARQPFNLGRAPLLRVQLLQLPGQRHVLAWVLHHLVADGWSRGVLLRELSALYTAASDGRRDLAGVLPAPASSYAQHLRRQHAWLASAAAAAEADWWRDRLAGLAPLELPTDRPHSPAADWRSHTVQRGLPDVSARVAAAAQRCGATPFMFLLTAFKLLLYRWTGRRDLAVGIPVAGRSAPQDAGLIGFFVNTLVVRSQGPESGHVADWVEAVKHSVADVFDHAELPLARVIEALGAAREPGRAPLVELMFQYQGAGYGAQNASALQLGTLPMTQAPIDIEHTKFDLTWHAIERDQGLLLAVEYRSALFDAPRIDRLLDHFARLLDGMLDDVLSDAQQPLGRLPMLSAAELDGIGAWQNGPRRAAHGAWRDFSQLFAAQAALTPEAIAVATPGGQALSYDALAQRAAALATELRARGVGAECIVGVCLPRVPELMVAMLAVWQAGAAWLALDPVLPLQRLRYMAQDSGAKLLLAMPDDAARLREGDESLPPLLTLPLPDGALHDSATHHGATHHGAAHCGAVRDADDPDAAVPGASTAAAAVLDAGATHPEQLAYVLYTSGSTGRPKGTLLPHGALMHYLDWCLERYPLREGGGAPVNSSIGFDATLTGLLAPLLVGGTVTLLPEERTLAALADAMGAGHSLVKLTPAHMSALAPLMDSRPAPEPGRLPKAFVIGGEALTEAHVDYWRTRFPGIALLNEYGPTETVVGCCVHEVTPDDVGAMPIGRPITGASMYLLDAELNPVPAGAVGEVYIGGTGMARGYLQRPALTAERFLPDPFAAALGVRAATMYRSGDLARWRPDGAILYLGRADQQLKLRGHRIEAGEVEAALVRQPGIAEAVAGVVAVGAAPALVAWLRLAPGHAAPDVPALRSALGAWLPAYMVPGHIVLMDTLPLTPNGKIDRAALPPPAVAEGGQGAPIDEADTVLRQLHKVWCEVLRRESIGSDANFFDLGGDSVAAMQIVARAHQLGLTLSPADVFAHQTLAAQARAARASASDLIDAVLDGEVAVLSPAQWAFFERVKRGEIAEPAHWNQSLLLDVDPSLDAPRLAAALQSLPQTHAAMRQRFAPKADGSGWHAWHAGAADVPLDCVDVADGVALQETMTAAQRSLLLEQGPLLRAYLCRKLDDGSARLLLVAHHLVVDGLSWRLLLSDLAQALAQPDAPVPAAPAFAHWSAALAAQAGALARESEYWRDAARPGAPLPRAPGAAASAREAQADERQALHDIADSARLARAAQVMGCRPDTLLLTALAQTLQQWARGASLLIDVESHGRGLDGLSIDASVASDVVSDAAPDATTAAEAAKLSRSVGWFTAQWPLRLVLPAGAPRRQLDAVAAALAAVPQRGLGFGVLRREGSVPASAAEISFNHLGAVEAGGFGPLRGLAPEIVPAQRDPGALRAHLIEVITLQRDGRLHWLWRHDPRVAAATIDALARRTVTHLQSLLALAESA